MPPGIAVLAAVFWLAAGAVVWTYAGYPVFIFLLARLRPRPHRQEEILPSVSLVIPAYNEQDVIAEKLENTLALDYPSRQREIIVVADGSDDGTMEIVRTYAPQGVRLLYQPQRRGKIAAMNRAVPQAEGEILVFSDANAMIDPDSLRALVRNFADHQVACVSGEKRIQPDDQVQAQGESAYWRYEAFLKRADSLVNTAIGAVGEFFAIRRERYRRMEEDCLVEDFVLAMRLVMDGWRVVYEPQAVAWETASPSLRGEWERRARMAAGGFQAIGRLRGLFVPRHALAAFQFLSHKILRWLSPFLMVLAWGSAAALYGRPLYRVIFWLETAFYGAALAGWGTVLLEWPCRPLRMVFYFCFANATALAGFFRYITGRQPVTWEKAR